MDTRGARELAKRLADEERRRTAAARDAGAAEETVTGEHVDASDDSDPGMIAAVERLQEELASVRADLATREDSIARLRSELSELRATTSGADDSSSANRSDDEAATGHILFVSGPSSYGLVLREGRAPEIGSEIVLSDWAEGRYRVCKVGPSPLPSDRRRCAFLERLS